MPPCIAIGVVLDLSILPYLSPSIITGLPLFALPNSSAPDPIRRDRQQNDDVDGTWKGEQAERQRATPRSAAWGVAGRRRRAAGCSEWRRPLASAGYKSAAVRAGPAYPPYREVKIAVYADR